jgi:hypothetical protein
MDEEQEFEFRTAKGAYQKNMKGKWVYCSWNNIDRYPERDVVFLTNFELRILKRLRKWTSPYPDLMKIHTSSVREKH